MDAAGNQSPPAVSAYLNFQLLPVSGITVVQADAEAPIVTWTHPGGSIAGYDIYLGTQADGVKLNVELLAEQSYTDVGWAGDARQYTIVAVDTNEVESLGRSIALPLVEAAFPPDALVRRGVMNRLTYTVENGSTERVENIRLKVDLAGHLHTSDKFGIDAGQATVVPVVAGGFSDLPDLAEVNTTVEMTPGTGETVRIVRSSQVDVADGMLAVQIQNEEFTRGASGTVRFTVENTGEEEIEIVTAKNSGSAASDQVFIYLLDEDDNVIATKAFKQAVGDMLVTLSNKNTVARIPAGATFTTAPLEINVPANAPDNITIKLSIANIYYHQGQETQVQMAGLSTTHPVTLVDTTYYGEIVSITPESAAGAQDITIVGRAVERATGEPLADVPLNLVITLNGFERKYAVFTGIDGTFAHVFKPLAGESGIYKVRAVHPDLTDKPVMGQFVITRVSVTPTTINLNQPKNYTKTIGIKVTTGEGTVANNLHLEYSATDQPAGDYPQGVHLTVGSPVAALSAKTTATLNVTIFADNSAAATETLKLKVISDEGTWGTVTINAGFSDAKPVLYFSPDHVETGVARDNTVTESVVLENRGLSAMNGVTLSLVNPDGSPAPDWVVLNSAGSLGDLQVGQKQQVAVAFSPTASVAEGVYAFKLRVASANYPARDINLYVSVTQSGIGGVLFKVADIYTGTLNANQQIVQGLAGAKVRLQNEAVLTEEYNKTTDSLGEAFFEELPAGRYKARVTAANHQEVIGRVWVKPGVTAVEDVFLDVNLVTVEWSVTETTIQDKYDIVLTAIYETNVPAAVVAVEPTSIVLPKMRAGDVYNGEITLTNYGLIRAEALTFSLPGSDQNFKFELLSGSLPETIAAKERIVIPLPGHLPAVPGPGGGRHRRRLQPLRALHDRRLRLHVHQRPVDQLQRAPLLDLQLRRLRQRCGRHRGHRRRRYLEPGHRHRRRQHLFAGPGPAHHRRGQVLPRAETKRGLLLSMLSEGRGDKLHPERILLGQPGDARVLPGGVRPCGQGARGHDRGQALVLRGPVALGAHAPQPGLQAGRPGPENRDHRKGRGDLHGRGRQCRRVHPRVLPHRQDRNRLALGAQERRVQALRRRRPPDRIRQPHRCHRQPSV